MALLLKLTLGTVSLLGIQDQKKKKEVCKNYDTQIFICLDVLKTCSKRNHIGLE